MLSADELASIDAITRHEDRQFDHLVRMAGLDPKTDLRFANLRLVDFRGADIRGFDFSGADLRYSTKDQLTLIDDTTKFDDAIIDWIEEDEVPIVQRMLEAQAATSSSSRRQALEELVNNYSSSSHINKYLLKSIENSGSIEACLDFCDYLVGELPTAFVANVGHKLALLVEKKAKEAARRTGRKSTALLSVEPIVERLEKARSITVKTLYSALLKYETDKLEKNPEIFNEQTVTLDDIQRSFRSFRAENPLL
jgi:hypothetical protein